jgi:hypothetical protein
MGDLQPWEAGNAKLKKDFVDPGLLREPKHLQVREESLHHGGNDGQSEIS